MLSSKSLNLQLWDTDLKPLSNPPTNPNQNIKAKLKQLKDNRRE